MRVDELMTKDVSFCNPATNAAVAAELMWNRDCGVLPVLEDSGRVIGIVTDRDLFIALGTQNRRAADLPVGEIMRQGPSVCAPGDDLRHALKTMAKEHIHRLLVTDESGALKGILSMDDVVLRTDSVFKDDVIRTLKAICDRPPRKTQQELGQTEPTAA